MASGAGFQMDAIKSQSGNRRLLKKHDAFDKIKENKFINAPNLRIKVAAGFYHSLNIIKEERMKKESKTKKVIYLCVSAVIGSIIVGFLYFSGQ